MRSFLLPTSPIRLAVRPLAGALVLTVCSVMAAQKPARTAPPASPVAPAPAAVPEWETLRPEGETFSVQMPKGSTFEAAKAPYHKMELNTRTYLSNHTPGPVFAIVSLSGIKSNPALYTELQRVNSYVDAFKELFAPKVRKGGVARLSLVGDKTLAGNAGREYRMTLGDLAGTAQVFATRKRFYALVYLNTRKDDAQQEQFLSSFSLPQYFPETAVTAQAEEEPPVARPQGEPPAKAQPADSAEPKQLDPAQATSEPGKHKPIAGGVLNGKAISLPKPDYPAEARAAGLEGVVVVQVTVDEQGNVIEARPVSGPQLLQQPAVIAAQLAKFAPTLLMGEPVKVTGVIVFNFGRPQN